MRRFMPFVVPAAWIAAALLVLTLGPGCAPIPPPQLDCRTLGCPTGYHCVMDDSKVEAVYHCVPDEPPPPPPPPVVHEPVCEPNTNSDCWVQPPDEDWKLLTCTAPDSCVNHICIPPPPPPPNLT